MSTTTTSPATPAVPAGPSHISIKCAVVGDAATGKTALLETLLNKRFPESYSPTMCESYRYTTTEKDGTLVVVDITDCAGNEDFAKLRTSFYVGINVFLLCYSISSPSSLENITKKWQQEIASQCPKAAIILVGTKLDLREDKDTTEALKQKKLKPVSQSNGKAKAKEINAYSYVECSSKSKKNLQAVFDDLPKAKQPSGFINKLISW
jgi:Ras-related C3 botulinum toxin substrate 1